MSAEPTLPPAGDSRGPISIDVIGLEAVVAIFTALPEKVARAEIRKATRQGLRLVQQAARDNVPVKTGALRKAIKIRAGQRSRKALGTEVRVGEGWGKGEQFYGSFIEFGTKKIEPRHFLLNAYKKHRDAAKLIVTQALWDAIAAHLKPTGTIDQGRP